MRLAILFFSIVCIACTESEKGSIVSTPLKDNAELQVIRDEDQRDRLSGPIDWSVVSVRDSIRKDRVEQLLDSNLVRTSKDYQNAALVFQHGGDTSSYKMAIYCMEKAIELDTSISKWLLAAATDRYLMRKGESQLYGTQYGKRNGIWELYEVDSTFPDSKRIAMYVPTLAESRERMRLKNLKAIKTLWETGIEMPKLVQLILEEDTISTLYDISEASLNSFGYGLMNAGELVDCEAIFELNTILYPEAFNTWDSYGEILLEVGRTEDGIKAYEKSLEINPQNDNAKEVLAGLKQS